MKLLLTGGGTAGHVNPALAIAEIFASNIPGIEIHYVGTPRGMEKRLVGAVGIPYHEIEICGLSRSLSLKNLRAIYLAITSPQKAKKLLLELSPDLVVGTGGYVSWPVLSAAASLGIPCAIHESNAIPGLTVKRLSRRVDLVLLNFPEVAELLPSKARSIHVGNPLRAGFSSVTRASARSLLGIPEDAKLTVSFGGSLGAGGINNAVLDLFEKYTLGTKDAYHIHGCGTRYAEKMAAEIRRRFGTLPDRIRVSEYLDRMPYLMAAADLLICRSGAMTVTEIALSRRASILIPSPNVAGDHQTKNAEALVALGAATLIPENELSGDRLASEITAILSDDRRRHSMEAAAAKFGIHDANRRIFSALSPLIGRQK